jgi:hypothetical protein
MMGGLLIAQGSKAKPNFKSGQSCQSDLSEERSDTKGALQKAHLVPHGGNLASSTFISESRLGGFHQAALSGLASSRPNFLGGLSRKDA